MRKILETFFMILIFLGLMKIADIVLNAFIREIAVINVLAVVAAFISLIISAALSEQIVKLIKKYL